MLSRGRRKLPQQDFIHSGLRGRGIGSGCSQGFEEDFGLCRFLISVPLSVVKAFGFPITAMPAITRDLGDYRPLRPLW
jgi:hypothetical protein